MTATMPRVVALAASAGGLHAISEVLGGITPEFPVPIVVLQHLHPEHTSHLTEILRRRTRLDVRVAESGEYLQAGIVYVAPRNCHLLISPDHRFVLSSDPLVHFVRPSADRLFASIADAYEKGAIVVVLSGSGSDGESGTRAVKAHGGIVIAQDEATSEHFSMPSAAIRTGSVDFVLPLSDIASCLLGLVSQRTA